jgi:RecA-family ATPase
LLDFEGTISFEGEAEPIAAPEVHDPVNEIITYLRARFEPGEYIGYVTSVYEDSETGKLSPTRGNYDRTAGQIIDLLEKCGGDIGSVLGDADPRAGAWIRVNPLDGKGIKDENVTSYRYVLIESDSLPIEQQNALMHDLELPIVTLTYTGGKSLHAIVKVDASSREEYRQRVAFLFDICEKNGLRIDRSCKNPSRLTRLPGFRRGDNWQYLIDTNIGKESFEEWKDYIEETTDDLPDAESAADFWDNIPPLRPALIDGVLRQGHKMLLAGPSKAGKSFALIALAVAIAEGKSWMGFKCTQGRVWYVNLELDDISCKHRIRDVYEALGIEPKNTANLDIWNLRGRSLPMDKLAPSMIRRAKRRGYTAIIIDPIYKVITGDENSAEQMAHFCNQFDRVCAGADCAVIYCHHHSKGAQGGKRSMDRASGSGVFARDPDALLDMIELPISEQLRKSEEDKAVCTVCKDWLRRFVPDYDSEVSQDDEQSRSRMMEHCNNYLKRNSIDLMQKDIAEAVLRVQMRTAWRIDGTLREFPKFPAVNVWFEYPVHRADQTGVLKDIDPDSGVYDKMRNLSKRKTNEERKADRGTEIDIAFENCMVDGVAMLSDLIETTGKSEDTVRRHLKEHGGFWIEDGKCGRKQEAAKLK